MRFICSRLTRSLGAVRPGEPDAMWPHVGRPNRGRSTGHRIPWVRHFTTTWVVSGRSGLFANLPSGSIARGRARPSALSPRPAAGRGSWFRSRGFPLGRRAHCETVPVRRKRFLCCARQSTVLVWRSAKERRYRWPPRPGRRSCGQVPDALPLSRNRDRAGAGPQRAPPGHVPPPR